MKKQKGFTLVELVITIAIVIILSVVSVPIYRGYMDKAKLSEGYALLGTILSAQKNYFSEYGNFLDDGNGTPTGSTSWYTCNEPILGIDARGNKYFTWFHAGDYERVTGGNIRHTIAMRVKIPDDLVKANDKQSLIMIYCVTNGGQTKIREGSYFSLE